MNAISPSRTSAGVVSLIGAQAVFLVFSYALHMVLARVLGPAEYGIYGIVFNLLSVVYVLVNAGVPQAVARYVAAGPDLIQSIKRRALLLQAATAVVIAALYALAGGPIAALLGDPTLAFFFQVSAIAVPTYALYALWTGFLGGLHLFVAQAAITSLYAVSKMVAVCILGYAAGIGGAIVGLTVSPLLALGVALRLVPAGKEAYAGRVSTSSLLGFAGPFTVFAVSAELLTMLDLYLAKAFVGDANAIGYYTAASSIARVPYFLFLGLGAAMLPSVSRAVAEGDGEKTDRLFKEALRLVVLVAAPAVALTATLAGPVIDLLFSSLYAPAAAQLPLLTAGMSLTALFRVCASLESGEGHEKESMWTGLLALVVGLVGGAYLAATFGLTGAALANLLMGATAAGVALVRVASRHGRAIPIGSLWRAMVAVAPAVVLAELVSGSLAGIATAVVLGGLAYVVLLVLLREVGRDDVRLALSLLPGRASL